MILGVETAGLSVTEGSESLHEEEQSLSWRMGAGPQSDFLPPLISRYPSMLSLGSTGPNICAMGVY